MESEPGPEMDLRTACSLGDEDFVNEILERGSEDKDSQGVEGWTPLMYACWGSHNEVVTLLIKAGASKESLNDLGQSPLLLAASSGNLNIVKLTYEKKILDHMDKKGKTALFCAVDYGYLEIANFLLREGADVNFSCDGMTPLMVAAESGQQPLVVLLLAYGAHKCVHNKQGLTAHQLAERQGHLHLAQLLEPPQYFTNLKSFLEYLSLEKYWPVFESYGVDLQTFLNMNEDDFKTLGIKLLGPRRKMSLAISAYTKGQPVLRKLSK